MQLTTVRLVAGMILAVALSLATIACKNPEDSDFYNVEYTITGTATSCFITYENSSGGTSQIADASIPWSYVFKGGEGDFVYVSAQNDGETGSITATVLRNGKVFKRSTSTGAYVIASASGSL